MKKTLIATQGYPGSFHDQAVRQLFDGLIEIIPFDSFEDTFRAVETGQAQYAVCAVENSVYGIVDETYDLLRDYRFWISGEIYLKIEQHLVGLPGTTLESITDVYSHFVALGQCNHFLDKQLAHADRHEHPDTAGAIADIKKWGDPRKAAIGSAGAAELYDLPILASAVQNDKQNYTRFVVLAPHPRMNAEATKTSLVVDTRHVPGALYHTLGAFADQNINLSMLTSRPIVGDPGHYRFYIDINTGTQSDAFQKASTAIEQAGGVVNVLGSYLAASLPWNGK